VKHVSGCLFLFHSVTLAVTSEQVELQNFTSSVDEHIAKVKAEALAAAVNLVSATVTSTEFHS
jgi:hypothetical protein